MRSVRAKRTLLLLLALALAAGILPGTMLAVEAGVADNWTVGISATGNNLYGVCYGGGTYVAVGEGGTILTSSDGINWVPRTSGTADRLLSVATDGSGTFVAVGPNGTFVTSTNGGVNWAQGTVGSMSSYGTICYGSGMFMAFFDGACYVSNDGTAWTSQNPTDGYPIYGLASEGGTFIGVGYPDDYSSPMGDILIKIMKSTDDGLNWSSDNTHQGSENLNSVCSGGIDGFVAVGDGGRTFTSPTGDAWTERGTYTVNRFLNGVCYGDAAFVAVGEHNLNGIILTSIDGGISWVSQTVPTTEILRGVCYGGGAFVAVGDSGRILTSVSNASPVVATTAGKTAYTENGSPVAVDTGIIVADADPDDTTLAGGTVSITGSFQSGQDVLSFSNDGSTMGNITASYNAATGVLTMTSSGATATIAQWQAALRSVKYANSSDNPGISDRTISFKVNDGTADSAAGTKTVSMTAVNDAPVLTCSDGTTAYEENALPVAVDGGLVVFDADSPALITASVTIINNFSVMKDVLSFINDGSTMGNIEADYNPATGVLAMSSPGWTATPAQWQAALRSVKYSNTSDNPDTFTRTIFLNVYDDDFEGATATKDISVTAVNDAPVVSCSGGTTAYTENGSPIEVDQGMTVLDVDSSTLVAAAVSITGSFQPGQDILSFINDGSSMGNIAASYDAATGVLTMNSPGATATLAQWQSALRNVRYANTSDNPNTSSRTVNFTVNDGAADSAAAAKAVSVAAVNDGPVITSGDAANFSENSTGAAYTAAGNDPDSTITWSISGLDSSDFNIDSNAGEITFAGGAPDFEAPTDSNNDNIYNLDITATDGSLSDTKPITITVVDVNEAPVITSGAAASFEENSTGVAYTAVGTDPDSIIQWSITGGADAAEFSIDADAGALTFESIPDYEAPTDPDANNVYNVTVSASDGSLTASKDIAITVSDVNESPTDISLSQASIYAKATGMNAVVGTLSSTDPEGGAFMYALTAGIGDADNSSFNISGSSLRTNSVLSLDTYRINLRTTDSGGLWYEESLIISVVNMDGKGLTPDTTNDSVDDDMEITFEADADFENAITGVSFRGNALSAVQYTVSSGKVTLHPSADTGSPISNGYLRIPGTGEIAITAAGYDVSTVSQTIKAGAVNSLVVSRQPEAGAASGEPFTTQPQVTLQDRYGNVCATGVSAYAAVTASASGTWTMGGTMTGIAASGVVTFNDLTCTLAAPGTGAIVFTCASSTVASDSFTIPLRAGKTLIADSNGNNVDNDIEITFTPDATFEGAITGISFRGNALSTVQYTVGSGKVTLHPGADTGNTVTNSYLRTPATGQVVVVSAGYPSTGVEQTILPGAPAAIEVTNDITAPSANGGQFVLQPEITLKDSYGNICTNDNSTVVTVSRKDTGSWTLTGTTQAVSNGGVAVFTDLGASNTAQVTGARLAFSVSGLTEVTSREVTLPAIDTPANPVITSVSAGDRHVELTWDKVTGATGYNIYTSMVEGNYGALEQTVSGAVYGSDIKGLTNGTTYYFAVTAVNDGGESGYSDQISATPQVTAPGAPVLHQPAAGDESVQLSWEPVLGASKYIVFSRLDGTADHKQELTVSQAVYSAEVTRLENGIMYWFHVRAVNLGGYADSEEKSATPRTIPGAPTGVTAIAGNGQAAVSFTAPADNGGSPVIKYRVVSNPGNVTKESSGSPVTITGLTNGTSYTFTVTAINAVGSSAGTTSNSVIPKAPSSNNDGDKDKDDDDDRQPAQPSAPPANAPGETGKPGGNPVGTTTTTEEGGRTVTTVYVDGNKLDTVLKSSGNGAVVTIPMEGSSQVVSGVLNGQMVKNMENREAVLEIKTENVTYTLPASEIDIDAVSEEIGSQVALKDIRVNITISVPSEDIARIVEDSADRNSYRLVVEPIEFEITCTSGGRTVNVSRFNGYVERTIAIPEGVDPTRITTGIVLNSDGTFSHVPTTIIVADGRYYARINSLTNSIYSVIWNPCTFSDAEGHWAMEEINDMGSRLVMEGNTKGLFEPDREITRAEFAAVVVKALGLYRPGTGRDIYADVRKTDWYYDVVYTAAEYGLINGNGNGSYEADRKITREEAMAIIARAMKLTGLEGSIDGVAAVKALEMYKDSGMVGSWARIPVAACIETGIVQGNGDTLRAEANITRAEAAVMIRRLLQKSGLI